jgi:hypothetical protein
MALSWSDLTCTPREDALESLATHWSWRLAEPFTPLLFSALGDVFLRPDSGGIWWLNTGTAELTQVADTIQKFQGLLNEEVATQWFMPGLIEQLHAAGKAPEPGECYTYVALPLLCDAPYTVENLNPVPARDHFSLTGEVLRQIDSLPDGSQLAIQRAP